MKNQNDLKKMLQSFVSDFINGLVKFNLFTQNSKIVKTGKKMNVRLFNFGIPAYMSMTGLKTCPFAQECVEFCYGLGGCYQFSNVKPAFEKRLAVTLTSNFITLATNEIIRKKIEFLRVHDTGDYYSEEYLQKWFKIARLNPEVNFYSYTNNVEMIKKSKIPENFDFIFSSYGKQKNLIKPNDRQAKIFENELYLKFKGFENCSENDLLSTKWFSENKKVGLIKH